VSGPGFTEVLHFDAGRLHAAAQAWGRLADLAAQRAAQVTEPLRSADQAWQGPAAQAASRRARGLRAALEATPLPLRRHEQILLDLAYAGERLRYHARQLVARAATAGVRIHPDGTVTPVGPDLAAAQRAAVTLRAEVAEVLAEAARVDAEAVRRLDEVAPWPDCQAHTYVPRAAIPETGAEPAAVHRWWHGLDPAQRRYLLAEHPALVGALDGVPVDARDQANQSLIGPAREELTARLDELAHRLDTMLVTPGTRLAAMRLEQEIAAVNATLASLDLIQRLRTGRTDDGRRSYLVRFDPDGDGRVVLAIGNPDHADHVVTYVPGTGSELADIGGDMRRTAAMRDDAREVASGERTAGVYWLDYDAPDTLLAATSDRYAREAGGDLRRFADGLRVTNDGTRHTVLGHSYGSTVVGHSAAGGLSADSLIFVGSPGVGVGSAADLRIDTDPHDNVWSVTAWSDEINLTSGRHWRTGLGATGWLLNRLDLPDMPHGLNPTDAGFGGRTFPADGLSRHSGYWDEGNVARDHIARIVTGHPDG
jgi:predicted transcriptional regulator